MIANGDQEVGRAVYGLSKKKKDGLRRKKTELGAKRGRGRNRRGYNRGAWG